MQRNQITTVKDLKVGDRFYKVSDRSKTVYEITDIKNHFLNPKYACLEAQIADHATLQEKVYAFAKPIAAHTPVIFLRSKAKQ